MCMAAMESTACPERLSLVILNDSEGSTVMGNEILRYRSE